MNSLWWITAISFLENCSFPLRPGLDDGYNSRPNHERMTYRRRWRLRRPKLSWRVMFSKKCFCQNDEDLPNAKLLQAIFSDVRRHLSYDLSIINTFDYWYWIWTEMNFQIDIAFRINQYFYCMYLWDYIERKHDTGTYWTYTISPYFEQYFPLLM